MAFFFIRNERYSVLQIDAQSLSLIHKNLSKAKHTLERMNQLAIAKGCNSKEFLAFSVRNRIDATLH